MTPSGTSTQRQRFIGEMTDPRIERAHFSPWWNVLGRRTYENAAIHDLFYLHEMSHMAMLVYEDSMSWEAWAAKMADNEMLASLESETLVYLALPSLRAKSFDGQIWADRFLGEGEEAYGGRPGCGALRRVAPADGLEPPTRWLTATCSTD